MSATEHRLTGFAKGLPNAGVFHAAYSECSCGWRSRVVIDTAEARYLWWAHANMTAAVEAISDQLAFPVGQR